MVHYWLPLGKQQLIKHIKKHLQITDSLRLKMENLERFCGTSICRWPSRPLAALSSKIALSMDGLVSRSEETRESSLRTILPNSELSSGPHMTAHKKSPALRGFFYRWRAWRDCAALPCAAPLRAALPSSGPR